MIIYFVVAYKSKTIDEILGKGAVKNTINKLKNKITIILTSHYLEEIENTKGNIRIITNSTTSNINSNIKTTDGTIEVENKKGDLI